MIKGTDVSVLSIFEEIVYAILVPTAGFSFLDLQQEAVYILSETRVWQTVPSNWLTRFISCNYAGKVPEFWAVAVYDVMEMETIDDLSKTSSLAFLYQFWKKFFNTF